MLVKEPDLLCSKSMTQSEEVKFPPTLMNVTNSTIRFFIQVCNAEVYITQITLLYAKVLNCCSTEEFQQAWLKAKGLC